MLLKYDIYRDDLILNPYDEANSTKINLHKENIKSFTISNEKFVNLTDLPTIFKGGFYEEIILKNETTLYIKYLKEKKRSIE
ncbi:hypothetical protein ACFFWB_26860 [Flavobacterium procerum]|uniref:hypothetical protein n=1 Tax=Flavobacterium procerum TaxID=1455569 RepID=UPI0035E63D57